MQTSQVLEFDDPTNVFAISQLPKYVVINGFKLHKIRF